MIDTRFNVIKRNEVGNLIVEYEIYRNTEIQIPLDDNGNEIRGDELKAHIQGIVNSLAGNTVFLDPDLSVAEEIGLLPEVVPDSNTVIEILEGLEANAEIVSTLNSQTQVDPALYDYPVPIPEDQVPMQDT